MPGAGVLLEVMGVLPEGDGAIVRGRGLGAKSCGDLWIQGGGLLATKAVTRRPGMSAAIGSGIKAAEATSDLKGAVFAQKS